MQSFNGPDTATIRYTSMGQDGASIKVEEESSADGETSHTTENVGFMALWPEGSEMEPEQEAE
jgi:hypothetical protein